MTTTETHQTGRELLEEELELLQRTKIVMLRSNLSAGILLIPEGLVAWNSETEDEPSFEDELLTALLEPARDIDSLTTFCPIIIRGPKELLKEVRHLKFDRSENLEVIQNRIDKVEERLADLDKLEEDVV